MTETSSYGQFCPVSMAAEVLCSRWTVVLLRELLCGSTRFNDLRRGLPRMSPTLLSKRLKELELSGVIRTVPAASGGFEYHLTEAGEELRPIVLGIGFWGQRWVESRLSLRNLDPTLLMWDMRRNLSTDPLPPRRCTIQFLYPELTPTQRNYWLVIESGQVDLCHVDPGFEIDLLVTSSNPNLPVFTNLYSSASQGPVGVWKGAVAWGDYDHDGDLDGVDTAGRGTAVRPGAAGWRSDHRAGDAGLAEAERLCPGRAQGRLSV